MTDFDSIRCGFNSADETINFGGRLIADGTNLYEAVTLASITSSKVNTQSSVHSINTFILNGSVYVAINKSLKVFKDRICSVVLHNKSFDDYIEALSISSCGKYLLVCLRNGQILLVDLEKGWKEIFKRELEKSSGCDEGYFCKAFFDTANDNEDYKFLIVSKQGLIFRISIKELNNSDNTEIDIITIKDNLGPVKTAAFSPPYLMLNGSKLSVLDLKNNIYDYEDNNLIIKRLFGFETFFLALDVYGNLYKICAVSLLVFPIHSATQYNDIALVLDKNGNHQLIVLTDCNVGDCKEILQVLSYFDLAEVYSIRISTKIHLIPSESINDEIMYISEILTSDHSRVKELRICEIRETQPEQRLKRLLKRQQFEEADQIAKHFNLNVELVKQARAQVIVDKMNCSSEEISQLLELLDLIEDSCFRLQCCWDVEENCVNINDVKRILDYGSRISANKKKIKRLKEFSQIENRFINYKHRFQTFEAINKNKVELQAWRKFTDCYLLDEIKHLLKKNKIEEALILYVRLDQTAKSQLDHSYISSILDIVDKFQTHGYQLFMPTFIQVSLKYLPSSLSIFLSWVKTKIFNMEQNWMEFPVNAIEFTENFIQLIKSQNLNAIQYENELQEFVLWLTALQKLKLLKDNYEINIPLLDYLSGPKTLIKSLLNIRMTAEIYRQFLDEFMINYIKENNLEPDEIFLNEISDFMLHDEKFWINGISAILDSISSVEMKLNAILTILENCKVPWSEPIKKIAQSALIYSQNPIADAIKQLIKEESIRNVLDNEIYAFEDNTIHDICDFKFLINRIIKCNQPTMMEDVYKLCTMPEYKLEADIMLIKNFAKNGNVEKILEILNSAQKDNLRVYVDIIFFNAELEISAPILQHNYYKIIYSVYMKTKIDTCDSYKNYYELLVTTYKIRKKFNIEITVEAVKKKKTEILNTVIESLIENLDCSNFYSQCQTVSVTFSENIDEILIKACSKIQDYNILMNVAMNFVNNVQNCRILSLLVVLLLRNLGIVNVNMNETSIQESFIVSENNLIELYSNGLIISEKLISKALSVAQDDEILACTEIGHWTNLSIYFCGHRENILQKELFGDICATVVSKMSVFQTINSIFEIYCEFIAKFKNPINKYLLYFINGNSNYSDLDLLNDLNSLKLDLKVLSREGQIGISYKILEILNRTLPSVPLVDKKIIQAIKTVNRDIPRLLQNLLSTPTKIPMIYSFLLACDKEIGLKILHNSLRIYRKSPEILRALLQIGMDYYDYHKMANKNILLTALFTVKWWFTLQNHNFCYETFFKMPPQQRIEYLMGQKCITIELLRQFCQDYHLNFQINLFYLLQYSIAGWKPDFEICGNGELLIKNDLKELLEQCFQIIDLIEDKKNLLESIKKLWASTNFYHYEMFDILLKIVVKVHPNYADKKKKQMLFFLKNYIRVSAPTALEKEQWFTEFPDTQQIDQLANYRLPFNNLFTEDIWKIIRFEMTLSTYEYWFNAVEIVPQYLNRNEICCRTIINIVESGILKDTTDKWIMYSSHKNLFNEIDKCVLHITDLEKGTSVLYDLFQHTPDGADKVWAAELCYLYASRYHDHNPNITNVNKAFIKVQQKYYQVSVAHILKLYNIDSKKYISYINNPEKLIEKLYYDNLILESVTQSLDINRAADNLAILFELDINKIRLNLMDHWIGTNNSDRFLFEEDDEDENKNFKRALYLCQSSNTSDWQAYLLKIGLSSSDDTKLESRIKALKLYALITNKQEIERSTKYPCNEFMILIEKLVIINDLGDIGITFDIPTLDNYKKKDLLKMLGQKSANEAIIKTMGNICMTYGISEVNYWAYIIKCAIEFKMISDLKKYVDFLDPVTFQFQNFYISAWQLIIEAQFVNLNNCSNEKLKHSLINNLLLIQSCPVLSTLNVEPIYNKCMQIGQLEFAAILLQYLRCNDKFVQEILDKNFKGDLDELSQHGIWGITKVKELLATREYKYI